MSHNHFDENHVLHELKHFLPTQTPLKDFIHHNSLHAFQHLKFYGAIFKASKIFGYQVTLQLTEYRELYATGRIKNEVLERVITEQKGAGQLGVWKEKLLHKTYDTHNAPRIGLLRANWKNRYKIDLDNAVQPLLFRILCSYLDEGISIWQFPALAEGFLSSLREMEKNSITSFFKTARARELLLHGNCEMDQLLKMVVGEERYFEQYLFDQQFTHRGWSGMVCALEAFPDAMLNRKIISLHDLIVFELLLEIDALDFQLGKSWQPLSSVVNTDPVNLLADVPSTELQEVFTFWQNAFEWSYYDEVLAGIQQLKKKTAACDFKIPPSRGGGKELPGYVLY